MLGIWKAQGIDVILKKALEKGIILAGGSAGSICWFQNGISGSRPVHLSVVDGLNFLPFSNCPHYSQEGRKEQYHQMILERKMPYGYATDDLAGILFINGKAVEFVSQSDRHNSYFVCVEKEKVAPQKMKSTTLLRKNALPEDSYTTILVNKKLNELLDSNANSSPLGAYISEISARLNKVDISESELNKITKIGIEKFFVYDNKIAGIVNDAYIDSFGYGLWYFYNCNGTWKSMGEDIGGTSMLESEITFREKAEIMMRAAAEKLNCH